MEPELSYKPYELGLQQIVSPPMYRMNKGTLKRFDTCEKSTITNFTYLLQYTAKNAILGKLPTFLKYNLDGIFFNILNYTTDIVTLSNKRQICVNKQQVLVLPKKNLYVIAYKIEEAPHITCLEIKEIFRSKAYPRCFILNDNGRFEFLNLFDPYIPSYFAQHYTHISKTKEMITVDPSLKMLVENIPKEADLTKNPKLLYFSARVQSCFFTVLNYTDHEITFDIIRNLCIDNEIFTCCSNRHCHIIAYHPERHPEIICFQHKKTFEIKLGDTFFAQKVVKQDELTKTAWKYTKLLSPEIFEDVRMHREFTASKAFYSGIKDENSILSRVPKDIFMLIFSNYDIQRFIEVLQTK